MNKADQTSPEFRFLLTLQAQVRSRLSQLAAETERRSIWAADPRCCSMCRTRVTNENIGGYSGRSALSGILFCQSCADGEARR
jgi:hypothetical protein